MPSPPAFRLFGFPVQVRSGFLMFMVLIVIINGISLGMWLAAFISVFTLLHELGHAFAAWATGAQAEISLDFMAGYAAFVPTRELLPVESAGISFAGPAVQIITGTTVYVLINGGWSWPHAADHAAFAALWAGPVIGLFNLIPILPFDGGNILEQLVSAVAPRHARKVMIWFTLTVVFSAVAYSFAHERLRPFIIFMVIPLISVAQMSQAGKSQAARRSGQATLARAEALAWGTGDVSTFPVGHVPSPWFRAHQQLSQGHPDTARELLLADLTSDEPVNWWPPDGAPRTALAALVALLPRPLPQGRPFSAFVLSGVLLRLGEYEPAAHYAAEAYRNGRPPMLALHVARAASALGDQATAIGWVRTAIAGTAHPDAIRQAVADAPEFDPLRNDPDFTRALAPA